jgi:protein tyrosine phosphatase
MNSANANVIIPRIWLGNKASSQDVDFLKQNNITVIFNCTKDIPFVQGPYTFYRVPVDDNLQKEEIRNMELWSPEIIVKLMKEYNQGKTILVHCAAGMQRSAAVVAMFLIAKYRCSVKEAISYTKSRRPIAFYINANFFDSITGFQRIFQSHAIGLNDPMVIQKIPFPTDFITNT